MRGEGNVLRSLVVTACALLLAPPAALADSLPSASLTAAFSPSSVPLDGSSTLTFALTAPDAGSISGAAFSAYAPNGIGLTPVTESECGGTLSVVESGFERPLISDVPSYVVQLTGASLVPATLCQFTLPVVGDAAGTTPLYLEAGQYVTPGTNPSLTVLPSAQPPVVSASIGKPQIEVGQTTTLTINVENPNPTTTLTALRVMAMQTSLSGITALKGVVSNTCGGGAGVISIGHNDVGAGLYMAQGSLPPGGACTIVASAVGTDDVVSQGGNAGVQVTGNTREGGAITPVVAPLRIVAPPPPPQPPKVSLSTSSGRMRIGKRVTVTVKLKNSNTAITLTGLGFTVRLPRGVAFAPRIPATDRCSGRASEHDGVLRVASGRLAAGGACQVRVTLVPLRRGTYHLSTGKVSSSAGNARAMSVTIRI